MHLHMEQTGATGQTAFSGLGPLSHDSESRAATSPNVFFNRVSPFSHVKKIIHIGYHHLEMRSALY